MKSGAVTGFATYVVEKGGQTMKRDYALQNFRARLAARTAAEPAAPWYVPVVRKPATTAQPETEAPAPSLWQRLVVRFNRLRAGSLR
jgi:hypothetical protein